MKGRSVGGIGQGDTVERNGQRKREDKGPARCDTGVYRHSGGGQ